MTLQTLANEDVSRMFAYVQSRKPSETAVSFFGGQWMSRDPESGDLRQADPRYRPMMTKITLGDG